MFVNDATAYEGVWSDIVASFWRVRDHPNVRIIFYEDVCVNLEATVRDLAEFLNVDLTIKEIQSCVERSSFVWMKQHSTLFDLGSPTPVADGGHVVRTGRSNRGAGLNATQRRCVDNAMRRRLQELSSDFPYDERYGAERGESMIGDRDVTANKDDACVGDMG